MIDQEKLDKAVEYLNSSLSPSFMYVMEDNDIEKILHILAMFSADIDVYRMGMIELDLSNMLGVTVQIYNTDECDADFAGEILEYGNMVYCKDDLSRKRFLGSVAQECAVVSMKRSLLINRMKECGSIYEM